MAENSKIEWCDHTFNPWIGCTEVSAACDHCYARTLAERYGWAKWGNEPRYRTSAANWQKPLTWDRKAKAAGERHRVFCASLADIFDNQAPEQWRADLWALIDVTPNLDWLLLTKRPQNIRKMLPPGFVHPNIWLGTTAENQKEYDRRFHGHLYDLPCIRFVSYEPALGPLTVAGEVYRPDWIICGGESGAHARTMDPAWARKLRDECNTARIAFFMKQMTGKKPIPPDLMVRQFPRAA